MLPMTLVPLWAVHLADGVLNGPALLIGWLLAAALAWAGSRRLHEFEIPHIAILTAMFFIASLIHVRIGPTSVHLLFNGLVGAVLVRRAALAIPVGLFLQAALIGHGGWTTLGVNTCVLVLPALLAGGTIERLRRINWGSRPWLRAGVVGLCVLVWLESLVASAVLLRYWGFTIEESSDISMLWTVLLHPAAIAAVLLLSLLAAWVERRLDHPPEFALGLLIGEGTVLLTLALNSAVLIGCGADDWRAIALLVFIAHLPIAAIEGVVLGFVVGFLARVRKPTITSA